MRLSLPLTIAALTSLIAGCAARVHYTYRGYAYGYGYHHGAYSTSYGSTNIQWNQPAMPAPTPYTQPAGAEIEVSGSDGSYGWQRSCNADVEIHRLSERMAQRGCQFESYGYDETKAMCAGVHVVLRRDATHVYRLCPAGVDRAACQAAWAPVIH
jgi:hypothetical protein